MSEEQPKLMRLPTNTTQRSASTLLAVRHGLVVIRNVAPDPAPRQTCAYLMPACRDISTHP